MKITRRGLLALPFAALAQAKAPTFVMPRKNGKTRLVGDFLESRQFSVEEIARIFRVDPRYVYDYQASTHRMNR